MQTDRYLPNFILKTPLRGITSFPMGVVRKYLREGDTVADIGCGPGYYSVKMAELNMGLKIISVDPNPRAIDDLKHTLSRKKINSVTPLCESAGSLGSISDSSVNFVLSHLMICCMSDHKGAMNATMRILKPGGYAFVSVNRRSSSNDSRDVTENEWEDLKKNYVVIEQGKSPMSRWIIIQKGD